MAAVAHDTRLGIDWVRAQAFLAEERHRFLVAHPRSRALEIDATRHLLFAVPLHWMTDWGTPCTLYAAQAQGAEITDVDGHTLADFCLGDTGAMFGHSPAPVARALAEQASRGYTTMLPTADAPWVAAELSRRFGLAQWQFALSASDANRFLLRWVRSATGRPRILVFNGCYHGTVDDVFVDLVDGLPRVRDSLLGQVYDLRAHTTVVEFNDLPALAAALAHGDIAAVLAEPVMTNIGMVLPEPGYWAAATTLIREAGSLLILDETHTISSGPSGYSGAHGLTPDALVLGKPLAGGLPGAAYGFSRALADAAREAKRSAPPGHSGIGTTLTAGMLTLAAIRANLESVMTDAAYATMSSLAQRLAEGLEDVIRRRRLPWCVTRVGARTEFQFSPHPPLNGSAAERILDPALEQVIHLGLLNRGVLITPFHNMMLVCPETRPEHVDLLLAALDEILHTITEC